MSRLRLVSLSGAVLLVLALLAGTVWLVKRQGDGEWEAAQQELKAKGEKLTVAELTLPEAPAGPDERNFFGDAMWKEIEEKKVGISSEGVDQYRPAVAADQQQLGVLTRPMPNAEAQELKKAWPRIAKAYDARMESSFGYGRVSLLWEVARRGKKENEMWRADAAGFTLMALQPAEPLLERIEELLKRPEARFPILYQDGIYPYLPHLMRLSAVAGAFRYRAQAEIQRGQSAEAARDVITLLRLPRTIRDERLGISYTVRLSLFGMAIAAMEYGMKTHAWSEENLVAFDEVLKEEDFLPGLSAALRRSRAEYNGVVDRSHNGDRGDIGRALDEIGWTGFFGVSWAERLGGNLSVRKYVTFFSRPDQASKNRVVQAMLERLQASGWRGIHTAPAFQMPPGFETDEFAESHPFARKAASNGIWTAQSAAFAQDRAVQGRLAITLERYFLAKKEYPEKLVTLVPEYLPALPDEVLTGKPMHYTRTASGEFLLWADGWNGKDDHGLADDLRRHLAEDDWVWGRP